MKKAAVLKTAWYWQKKTTGSWINRTEKKLQKQLQAHSVRLSSTEGQIPSLGGKITSLSGAGKTGYHMLGIEPRPMVANLQHICYLFPF